MRFPKNSEVVAQIILYYFPIRKLKRKQPHLFPLGKWERRANEFCARIVYSGKLQPSQVFGHHVVGDVKLDAQEKLFGLTTFNRFIGLSRGSIMLYMKLMDKKVTGFLTESREAACFTGEFSTLTH